VSREHPTYQLLSVTRFLVTSTGACFDPFPVSIGFAPLSVPTPSLWYITLFIPSSTTAFTFPDFFILFRRASSSKVFIASCCPNAPSHFARVGPAHVPFAHRCVNDTVLAPYLCTSSAQAADESGPRVTRCKWLLKRSTGTSETAGTARGGRTRVPRSVPEEGLERCVRTRSSNLRRHGPCTCTTAAGWGSHEFNVFSRMRLPSTAHRVDNVIHRSIEVVGLHYVPERRQSFLGLDFVIVRSSKDRLICRMRLLGYQVAARRYTVARNVLAAATKTLG
jgi:hypothetical protein